MADFVDFNLHNLFSIRLEDPTPDAIHAVKRQLGCPPSVFQGEPDLCVSYIDRFEMPMHHLMMGKAGFAEGRFFVMSGSGRNKFRVQVPFSELGRPCKVICERGTKEIPLLHLAINLRMLEKGLVPLHAAAFVYEGTGVIVNGWPNGGKTSTLFSFLTHGARFISDDWLFVDTDGRMVGLMQPIKLSDWQLNQLAAYQPKVSRTRQLTLQGMRMLDTMLQAVPGSLHSDFPPAKVVYKGLSRLNNSQRHINISPEELFGADQVAATGNFEMLLLTLSGESSDIVIEPLSPELAIERILATLHHEWMHWEEYYLQYSYAFPHRPNALMDVSRSRQRMFLEQILAGKRMFAIYHPHPVDLDRLYKAIVQVIK